ncbi:hypothetical protein QV12_06350 [Pseudomonas putida]|nr:hypothetical protein QV12_06350 [Pseudomonas putida]
MLHPFLLCDLYSGQVRVLARGLDTPFNLCRVQEPVLVSEGMGLAGRALPTPDGGLLGLSGRLRRVEL